MGFTWVEIDKKAIIHNLKSFRKLIGKDRLLMPVVKSNAYGHGILEIAKLIDKSKLADKICTVNSTEALLLQKNNIKSPIFILSYWAREDAKKLIKNNNKIEFSVYNLDQAKFLSSLKKNVKIHLKVDTGTSRLGVLSKDFILFVKKVVALPYLEIEGVFTHYANSEEDNLFTRKQTEKFELIKEELDKINIKVNNYHAACSAAILSSPNGKFDGMRLGLSLYGLRPSKHNSKIILKPALTWKTKIIQVKIIPKGEFIGYGCTYQTKKDTKIAVLPVGYNEGVPRILSGRGEVFINKHRCPILGRVCMNLIIVDVSKIKQVKVNDEVELIGKNITAEEFASWAETINYEVVTRINSNIERVYK
ncbi:MAG: alanine racemase [Patescibacteria group bacterium]